MLGLGTGINKLSSAEAASIASRSGGYLLDTYSGAAAAYSLRQLSSSYSGNAVKVRRSSDNTETDIGFVGGELDTASLSSFAGAGDAFVVSWFDQSGGTLGDLVQISSAQQRKIYDGSSGYVGYLERVSNGGLYRPATKTTISQPFSFFGVYDHGGLSGSYFFDAYGSNNRAGVIDNSGQNATQVFGGGSIYGARNITGTTITSAVFNGASSTVSVNGETAVTGTLTGSFDFITLGARYTGTSTSTNDKIFELVIYEDAKNDTDRVGIQNNLNGFYQAY
jgi:hypothetical protein